MANIISNLLAVFKTDASELPPAVRFVPAVYLFVHSEPLPDGMQPSEMDGFASVTLEGLAPLPLEQLAWGYLTHPKSRHMLIFGAFNDRLTVEHLSADESFFHVLPSFFAAAPANGAAQWVFIWEAGHLTAAHYAAGEVIPSRVEIERLKEDTLTEAFAARENFLKHLGGNARAEAAPGLLSRPDSTRASGNRLSFSFDHYDSPGAQPTRVPGHPPGGVAERWLADLRGNIFRGAEQHRRRAAATAGLVLKLAAASVLLLLIGQGTVIYFQYWVKGADAKIKSQMADVALVDQRVTLLGKISLFTDHELHPFEMIGVINPLRPAKVWYLKTRMYDNNKLSADCMSNDSTAVSDFVDALTRSGMVAVDNKLTIQTNPIANPPTYKFTINLTFNAVPKAQTEMPPEPPPPPTPEELAAEALAADTTPGPDTGQGPTPPDNTQPAPDAQPQYVPPQPTIFTNQPPPDTTPAPTPGPAPAPATDAAPAPAQ